MNNPTFIVNSNFSFHFHIINMKRIYIYPSLLLTHIIILVFLESCNSFSNQQAITQVETNNQNRSFENKRKRNQNKKTEFSSENTVRYESKELYKADKKSKTHGDNISGSTIKKKKKRKKVKFSSHKEEKKSTQINFKKTAYLSDVIAEKNILLKIASRGSWLDKLNYRSINKNSYKILSGYNLIASTGVYNLPNKYIDLYSSAYTFYIDYARLKNMPKNLDNIPSFIFYQVMRYVVGLPKEFWPYIKYTHINALVLKSMGLNNKDLEEIAKHLKGSKVLCIDLEHNKIDYQRADTFAEQLLENNVNIKVLKFKNCRINLSEQQNLKKKHRSIEWSF